MKKQAVLFPFSLTIFLSGLFLSSMSQSPELIVQEGLKKFKHVSFSPEGKYFSTHSDESIQIWNARNGNLIRSIPTEKGIFQNTYLMREGEYVIAGGNYDRRWRKYSVLDGQLVDSTSNSRYYVNCLDYAEDANVLVAGSGDKSFTIYRPDGIRIKVDSAHDIKLDEIGVSKDGRYVLTQGFETKLWDAIKGELIHEFPYATTTACLSKNGQWIALAEKIYNGGDDPQKIHIWSVHDRQEVSSFNAHESYIYSLHFNADGSMLASGSGDATAKIWETSSGKEIKHFQIGRLADPPDERKGTIIYAAKYTGTVGTVRLSEDGKTLLTEFRGREIAIWDVKSGLKLSEPAEGVTPVYSLAINEKDEVVIATGNELNVLSLRDFSIINRYSISNPRSVSLQKHVFTVLTAGGIASLSGYHFDTLYPSRSTPVGFHGSSDYRNPLWVFPSGRGWVAIDLETRMVKCRIEGTTEYRNPMVMGDSVVYFCDYGQELDPMQQLVELDGSQEQRMRAAKQMNAAKVLNAITYFSLNTCEKAGVVVEHDDEISALAYHSASNTLAVCTRRGTIYFRDGKSLALKFKTSVSKDIKRLYVIHSAVFNKDGSKLLLSCDRNDLLEYKIQEDALHYYFGHRSTVTSAVYTSDEERILSSSYDGSVKIWETGGRLLGSMIINEGNPLVFTPDFYYYAPKSQLSGVVFRIGKEVFPYYQFDMKYNRPDIVFQRLGKGDENLVTAYRMAYQKRLLNSGLSENQLNGVNTHLPEVSIRADKLEMVSEQRVINFTTDCRAENGLKEYQLWVNGIPVDGSLWKAFKEPGVKEVTLDLKLALSPGPNQIEVACRSLDGSESLKRSFRIIGPELKENPLTHVVILGVGEFDSEEMNLKYAVKDGKDLQSLFENASNKEHPVKVYTCFDRELNPKNLQKLKEKLMKSGIEDRVYLFVSGHGLLGADYSWYFASSTTDFEHPEKGGIPYAQIESLLDGIPARNRILFMDACHSGAVDKDTSDLLNNGGNPGLIAKEFGQKGGKVRNLQSMSLSNHFQLMQDQFADLNRGAGIQVISAAAGDSYALESDRWQNGVFTYAVIKGMRDNEADLNEDGQIQFSELRDYVSEEVEKQTNGKQKPVMRAEILERDFVVWP